MKRYVRIQKKSKRTHQVSRKDIGQSLHPETKKIGYDYEPEGNGTLLLLEWFKDLKRQVILFSQVPAVLWIVVSWKGRTRKTPSTSMVNLPTQSFYFESVTQQIRSVSTGQSQIGLKGWVEEKPKEKKIPVSRRKIWIHEHWKVWTLKKWIH